MSEAITVLNSEELFDVRKLYGFQQSLLNAGWVYGEGTDIFIPHGHKYGIPKVIVKLLEPTEIERDYDDFGETPTDTVELDEFVTDEIYFNLLTDALSDIEEPSFHFGSYPEGGTEINFGLTLKVPISSVVSIGLLSEESLKV